jgi:hypothetical protein
MQKTDTPTAGWDHLRGSRKLGPFHAAIDYLLICIGLVSLFFTEGDIFGDGLYRVAALTQLLSGNGLSAERYSLVGPLFATPMWWLGNEYGAVNLWLKRYNLVLFVLALLALFLLLRTRIDAVLLRRFLLLLVAGSMIAPHTNSFYGETFTAMTIGVGVLATVAITAHPAVRASGWVAMTLGSANTPTTLPSLTLVSGERSATTRRLRYLLPIVAGVGLVLGEAWIRRGNPLDFGYSKEHFSFPILLGVLAILFSFGKGLVFFTPGLLLPIRRKMRDLYNPAAIDVWVGYRSWMLFIGGMVLIYGGWWAWNGDLYWGPRYFLIAIFPASFALAIWLTQHDPRPLPNLALLGILALSVWVGANSTIFIWLKSPRCFPLGTTVEELCRFGVQDSQLWYPLQAWPPHLPFTKQLQLNYHILVFLWLAGPIVARAMPTVITQGRRLATALRRSDWRW